MTTIPVVTLLHAQGKEDSNNSIMGGMQRKEPTKNLLEFVNVPFLYQALLKLEAEIL